MTVFENVCVCVCDYTTVNVSQSKDNLVKLILSFHDVGVDLVQQAWWQEPLYTDTSPLPPNTSL